MIDFISIALSKALLRHPRYQLQRTVSEHCVEFCRKALIN